MVTSTPTNSWNLPALLGQKATGKEGSRQGTRSGGCKGWDQLLTFSAAWWLGWYWRWCCGLRLPQDWSSATPHGSAAPSPFPGVVEGIRAPSPEPDGTAAPALDATGRAPCSGSPGSGTAHPGFHSAVDLVPCPDAETGSALPGRLCFGIDSPGRLGSSTELRGPSGSRGWETGLPGSGTARLDPRGSDSGSPSLCGDTARPGPGLDLGVAPGLLPAGPGSLGSVAPAALRAPRSAAAGFPTASAGSR